MSDYISAFLVIFIGLPLVLLVLEFWINTFVGMFTKRGSPKLAYLPPKISEGDSDENEDT